MEGIYWSRSGRKYTQSGFSCSNSVLFLVIQIPKGIRVPALKETQHQWGQNYKQKPCMWQLLQITQEGEGRLSGDVSPQASGKKGIWHEKMFTLHCLVRKGFHTYFKGRKRNLREIRWLGQGHTAWKWQNLTLMTPRNKLSVLVTGSLRVGLRRSMVRWDCGRDVCGGHCLQGEAQRDKPGRKPGVLHLGEVTYKR